jgi:hypothetical protein
MEIPGAFRRVKKRPEAVEKSMRRLWNGSESWRRGERS